MDKYEYKLRSEEILKLIEEESYVEAAHIADTIDWRRVKSISMLLRVAALYRVNRRNEDSRAVLLLAYDRYPTNRSVVYSLCEVSIELDDVVAAIEYYKEFVKLAPRDNGVYTLRYRILEAQEANLEERIGVLEELKKRDYQEEWAYELAYHRVGLGTKCVEECDDLILWFGDGPYVTKAMELKMLHAPLTAIQQKKYDLVQRQLQGETVEEEQPYYEEENQEVYGEEYAQEQYADDSYAQEGYVQEEGYAQETYQQEDEYPQEAYQQEAQYVYADEENNEYTYYEGNSNADEYPQEESYVGSAYAEQPVQKQTTGSLDMSQYNTINLQKVVAESMRELFPDDEDVFSSEWTEVSADEAAVMETADEVSAVEMEQEESSIEEDIPEAEVIEDAEETEDIEADADETVFEEKADAVPVAVPVRNTNTGRVAALVTGVTETKPEPNTGAISKVILPGDDARVMKQDADLDELRSVTEEYVREEQDRIEENQENVYEEQPIALTEEVLPQEEPEVSTLTGQMNLDEVLNEWERRKKEIQEKRKEEVKQNVLRQTGKIFQNFDEAVKSGILAELDEEEAVPVRTETFLEDDETEELEEIETAEYSEYEMTEEAEQFDEEQTYGEEEIPEEEEQLSAIEQVIAQELGGSTVDIPPEQLEEALQAMSMQENDEYAEEMTFETVEEEALAEEVAEESYEEETCIEEEYTEESYMVESDEQEEYVNDYYAESEEYEEAEYAESEEIFEEEMTQEADEADVLKTQEISMNTEEISSLPDKIIEATDKETKAVKREEIREFTPEEKDLFENFAVTKKIRKQIIFALDTMSLAAYTGNVLITGEPGLGTVRMAKNLIREYQAMDANFSGKVAKITGEKLNLRDLREVFDKLKNGAIIIEKANGLTEETLYQLAGLLNQEELGIIVIMEDTRKEITKLLEKQAMIADYFNIRIDLMEMDNDALVAYAKNYALALEYSIDELGTLALYTRIANGQSGNHVVTKDEVREIVDEAIWKSRKFKIKNFVDVLFSKRYDSEDMIVLKERDFI